VAIESKIILTADEFQAFAGSPDRRYELVDGEVVEMSPPGAEHGGISFQVGLIVGNFVRQRHLGRLYASETGFLIRRSPDRVRATDLAFVASSRLAAGPNPSGYLAIAPDFVAEVVSSGDTALEVQQRVDDWLRAGTAVVWVVYSSSRAVLIWRGLDRADRRANDQELDAEPALPGFRCHVRDLFVEE
jgi:Uma2 family endonuclease